MQIEVYCGSQDQLQSMVEKLSTTYFGPFLILKKIIDVTHKLDLPPHIKAIHFFMLVDKALGTGDTLVTPREHVAIKDLT